jgi:hypothetical protein
LSFLNECKSRIVTECCYLFTNFAECCFFGVFFLDNGGLWRLTLLSIIFQLYPGGQFYWWVKSEYPEKISDFPQEKNWPPGYSWNIRNIIESSVKRHNPPLSKKKTPKKQHSAKLVNKSKNPCNQFINCKCWIFICLSMLIKEQIW